MIIGSFLTMVWLRYEAIDAGCGLGMRRLMLGVLVRCMGDLFASAHWDGLRSATEDRHQAF